MPQSINKVDPQYYQKKYDDLLIKQADAENLYQRFMLGEPLNTHKFLHTALMHEKVCVNSCAMLDYIWDVIEGKLEDKCPPKKDGLYKTYKIYEQVINEQNPCDVIDECAAKIEW